MPKRARSKEKEGNSAQPVKKRVVSKNKNMQIRDIKSVSSEKTIDMLFKASSQKPPRSEASIPIQCSCSNPDQESKRCHFCDKVICSSCLRTCNICEENYCEKCSLLMYDDDHDCICYSCVGNIDRNLPN